jgi:glyoxylase-like metal-dependent hydrolase (beta-lactamase superfamily II)
MLTRLSEHLSVYHGPVNVGLIASGGSHMLIDFGPGETMDALRKDGVGSVDLVAFTHHHRDQGCGAWRAREDGARIGVPEGERWLFDGVETYWADPANRWHLYGFHPHHLTLAEPLEVDDTYADGDVITWGEAEISVISTPGHTDGSISYVVDVDGSRTAFCGDLIYDGGRIWDVHSLQKGKGTTDYHGFMGSRDEVADSLRRLQGAEVDRLVPSHGPIVEEPGKAIDLLTERLNACYDAYASTSSLRYYFPQLFEGYESGDGILPIGRTLEVPPFLRHIGTTWLLISSDGASFAMDCGDAKVLDELREMEARGEIRGVEALWITHYHDDHVDTVPEAKRELGCQVIAEDHVADVVEEPGSWRLPCISPAQVDVDRRTKDGESWEWHEFRMTSLHLPGQTLYSGGLLVEGRGRRMLFSGDSFTPGGIDDHCCGNRNIMGKGIGYDRCLAALERTVPDIVFNSHVNVGFRFGHEDLALIGRNLQRRLDLFRGLLPWDDPNYGIDENWARCFPYEQTARAGEAATTYIVVTNHSQGARKTSTRLHLPSRWSGPRVTPWVTGVLAPGRESFLRVRFDVPHSLLPGRYILPVDLDLGGLYLPQLAETVVEVVH